jgi:2'-hydroxyisoflavone reductase
VKLLILGGTKFLGRAVVDAALASGHDVTLFNRGQTNPQLFPGIEKLRGDRNGDLSALRDRRWDVAVDPSGYVPRVVRASAELLQSAVGHYVFVSSISVYAEPVPPGFDENAPLIELEDPATEDLRAKPENYGGLKVLCERVVEEVFPEAHANVRPGLVVGPHDPTGRFTYWPVRVARGGDVLAPGSAERLVQIIDVRDLGEWIVQVAEEGIVGPFNAVCPAFPLGELLDVCRSVAASDARLVWVDEGFLLEQDVRPWMELPLWVPEGDAGFLQADVSRAVAAGLRFRPLAETVADTLAWARAGGGPSELASGIDLGEAGMRPEREAELLEAWRARA